MLQEGREQGVENDGAELSPAYVEWPDKAMCCMMAMLIPLRIRFSVSDKIQSILQAAGLKVATQKYEYTSAGITHKGENVYAIIHAPRGDATEAIVLVAAWRTADDELNLNGVTLALTLARYFKREYMTFSTCSGMFKS